MQYSPKLKKAMEEIKDILSKYDIAGIVLLHTPGNGEFLSKLDPTYSCIKVNGDQIRVKAKLQEDFQGDKEAWRQKVSDTANLLKTLSDMGAMVLSPVMTLSEQVDKIVGSDHNRPGYTGSHTTQNN